MSDVIGQAQSLTANGIRCVPVTVTLNTEGKKELQMPQWRDESAYPTTAEDVPAMWGEHTGIAINTEMSGLVVLDIDCKGDVDGFAGVKALNLPDTPLKSRTQSGGQHWYYRAGTTPTRSTASVLAPGVDTRGWGGIAFSPPTQVADSAYEWIVGEWKFDSLDDLPVFPDELAQRTQTGAGRTLPGSTEEWKAVLLTDEQRQAGHALVDAKLAEIAAAGAGERNVTAGRCVCRIIGVATTLGLDLDEVSGKIEAAYDQSGGDDHDQIENWIRSARRPGKTEPDDPAYWTAQSRAERFWAARPELEQIRQAALAGWASPWAVLGAVCVRVLAEVPPTFRLKTGIGSVEGGNLNLFTVLAAESGGGKGLASQVAVDLWPTDTYTTEVASGEALPRLFVTRTRGEFGYEDIPIRESAIIDAAEFNSLRASSERSGSTLMSRLCSAFSGEPLAFAVADEAKNISVPAHSYRLGLITGIQFSNAGALLAESSVATVQAQRFLWFPANIDDDDLPKVLPRFPGPLRRTPLPGVCAVEVCEQAKRDMRQARRATLVGRGEALDGHKLYARAKLAYALALLNGHYTSVRAEDWELAGIAVEVSDATRAKAQRAMSERERREDRRAGKRAGTRAAVAAEAEEGERLSRQVGVLRRKLERHPEGVSRGELSQALRSQWRGDYFDAALAELLDSGEVVEDVGRYRLSGQDGQDARPACPGV